MRREEGYPSPPPSAIGILSPPPFKNRVHAGHTPGRVGPTSAATDALGHKTPTQATFAEEERQSDKSTSETSESIDEESSLAEFNAKVDDPSLKSPLFLATKPEKSMDTLGQLQIRLEGLNGNPKLCKPAVCAAYTDSDADSEVNDQALDGSHGGQVDHGQDSATCGARQNSTSTPPNADGDTEIPLRIKPSMNFGKAFGRR